MFLKKFFIVSIFFLLPVASLAQGNISNPPTTKNPMLNRLQNVGTNAGYGAANETTVTEIVGMVINGMLALLGTIFIILMLLAGYNWMTAHGDEEKITKAKDTLRAAIIGLIIVIGAFAIWRFISDFLITSPGGSLPNNT
jgi:hypothetical protein